MITRQDAAVIKGMALRGDKQQWIAAWFGGDLNQGRINEIKKCTKGTVGEKFKDVLAAAPDALPPAGPYPSGRAVHRALMALEPALAAMERGVVPGMAAMQRAVKVLRGEAERDQDRERLIRQRQAEAEALHA